MHDLLDELVQARSLESWLNEGALEDEAVAMRVLLLRHDDETLLYAAPVATATRFVFEVRREDVLAAVPTGEIRRSCDVPVRVVRLFVSKHANLRRIESLPATGITDLDTPPAVAADPTSLFGLDRMAGNIQLLDIHAPGLTRVSLFVFFPKDVDNPDEDLESNPFGLQSVNRILVLPGDDEPDLPPSFDSPRRPPQTNPETLALLAVRELLDNPTEEEEAEGFYPLDTVDLGVSRVKIEDGIAQVVFFSNGGFKHFAGDLSRELFKEAVFRTVRLIPRVKDVLISLNL